MLLAQKNRWWLLLTILMLDSKIISLYHQCRARPALTRLYTVHWPTSNVRLNIPKIENGHKGGHIHLKNSAG